LLIGKPADIRPSEITSKDNYLNRREFIAAGVAAGGIALTPPALGAVVPRGNLEKLPGVGKSEFSTLETPTDYDDVTSYNNYWEFGTGKPDPAIYSTDFEPLPWRITVDGHAEKTGSFHFDDFIKPFNLEERIYRMRCVEAWSMVIPWVGISLADVVKLNVFLPDLGHFALVNEIMAEYFREPYPARAAVGVAALPKDAQVEMDAVMELGSS